MDIKEKERKAERKVGQAENDIDSVGTDAALTALSRSDKET
jgi:hypothetical protein